MYIVITIIIRRHATSLSGMVQLYSVVEMTHVNKNNSDYFISVYL